MTGDAGRQIEIHTDLWLESADTWARLVADGRHLRLVTDDVAALWAHTASASDHGFGSLRDGLRRAGLALDRAGLSAELVIPAGSLVQLGRGRGSRGGRLLAGGPHVGLGHPGVVSAAVFRSVKGLAPARSRVVCGVLTAGVVAAVAGRGLRHRFGQLGQSP